MESCQEFAPSVNDGVHLLTGDFNQTLPLRFEIGGSWMVRNGTRFNITTGRDSNGDGLFSERPSFASDPGKTGVIRTEYGILDPNPSPGDKIIPRNLGRGPAKFDFDLYVSKTFKFTGDANSGRNNLVFTLYVGNVFNIYNEGNPIGNMSSPRFIRIISGGAFDSTDQSILVSSPRSMNFSVRLSF